MRMLLAKLLDELPMMVFVKDLADEHRYIYWNTLAEEFWGFKRGEVIGKNDYDFWTKEEADFFIQKDKEVASGPGTLHIDCEPITTKSGKKFLRTTKTVVANSNGEKQFLLGVSYDITEDVHARDELDRQRKINQHSTKMALIGEMCAAIAHEINNPLAIISCYAEEMKSEIQAGQLNGIKIYEGLDKIEKNCDRIVKIVKSLKVFSRSESEDVGFVRHNLMNIVDDAVSLSQVKLKQNSVKLDVDSSSKIIFLECQPIGLSQALINLISNAIDAVSLVEEKEVKILIKEDLDEVTIRVLDNGHGIADEIHDKVMQPFFTTKPPGQGTGLGLSICKTIIEAHQGVIYLDKATRGTCFVMTLPKKQARKNLEAVV